MIHADAALSIDCSGKEIPAGQQQPRDDDQQEKRPTDEGERFNKPPPLPRVFAHVNAVVDDRSQRADQRAQPRSVGAVNEPRKILGKRIEHNAGGHVGDHLTQADRPPVFPTGHALIQKTGDRIVGGDGGGKHKEAQKSAQQRVIHLAEQLAVGNGDGKQHKNKHRRPITGAGHDDQQDQQKQPQIHPAQKALRRGRQAAFIKRDGFFDVFPVKNSQKNHQQQPGHQAKRQHMQHEPPAADAGLTVEEKILRAAERHQERAADGGDVFQADYGQDVPLFAGTSEQEDGQRHKDQQGHVVGDEHGGKEHAENQKQAQAEHGFQLADQIDQRAQHVFLLKALEHAKHHQQRAERAPVDLPQQRGGRRRDDEPRYGSQQRQGEHGFFFDQGKHAFHKSASLSKDLRELYHNGRSHSTKNIFCRKGQKRAFEKRSRR